MIFDRLFLEDKMIELLHYFMLDDLVNGLDLKLDEQGGFLFVGTRTACDDYSCTIK